jgi:6-pyruvoyl-tetrahydropterin synthase
MENKQEELKAQRQEALDLLEKMHTEGVFTINDRDYKLSKLSHQFRIEVVAVYSKIEAKMTMLDYSFLVEQNFKNIMKKIDEKILFDNSQISKLPNHFEDHPEDYFDYVATSMKLISYPLYKTKLHID